ncbi:hypothetical protein [Streptomyces sedi]|uniref:Uncharacterized protein n=1 Tax=Streptomyces sedi TaxID=555059 RepID=A0A5C4V2C8_9ACTN|nr:hypothetical protein [Streptomyces sedi]TNM29863.1 hypothetical protein FH715_14095 [Streptomyces sedi]
MTSPPEWEFLLPAPGREVWVDSSRVGPCWFFCGHRVTSVVWIGAITTVGAHAPLYACHDCLDQLHAMVWDCAESGWRARYRRPRTAFGRQLARRGEGGVP